MMMGAGNGKVDRSLYSIEAGQHKIHAIVNALTALPGISDVKFVALESRYGAKELEDARTLLYHYGLDTRSIPDDDLRNYFISLFAGEDKYVLHSWSRPDKNGVSPASIVLQTDLILEAAMQDHSRDITRVDSVTTIGDVTIEHVTYISELDAPDPPEVPAKRKQKGDK